MWLTIALIDMSLMRVMVWAQEMSLSMMASAASALSVTRSCQVLVEGGEWRLGDTMLDVSHADSRYAGPG